MSILMLLHLFLYYFFLSDLYFIPILPNRENRATILIVKAVFRLSHDLVTCDVDRDVSTAYCQLFTKMNNHNLFYEIF